MTEEKSYYTYMVSRSDNSLYTGFTTDLSHRVSVHNRGKGARYTRSRLPVCLVWYQKFSSEHDARSLEVRIKHLSKKEKEDMVISFTFTRSHTTHE